MDMKRLSESKYHELFRIGILVKAVDGIIEMVAGILVYFANYTAINGVLFSVFHEELAESPRDPVWEYLIQEWHRFLGSSHTFWGLLFMIHGIIKFLLSIALLKNLLWAYPTAAAVFTLFVGYEIYSLINRPSLFLLLITIFDAAVVGLILHEYRYIKKGRT
jgi:uncharacterized membrane protein